MSAEIFRQHRDRLCDAWVSAQAGVLALQAARARNERKSRILKWLTLIAGALTGAAGVDFLTATGVLAGGSEKAVISGLAFLTALLTGAAPLLAYDETVKKQIEVTQELRTLQKKVQDAIYSMAGRTLTGTDELEVSRLSDEVAALQRKEVIDDGDFHERAVAMKNGSAISRVAWIAPEAADAAAEAEPEPQAFADDIQPLSRG